jgi:superfamily I DNA/RNA helicase
MSESDPHATPETRVEPGQWDDAIAAVDGKQIVVGGPGTGKTEFLVRRVLQLIEVRGVAPERLLILSFGRRGVADLRRRILGGLHRSVSHLDIATFHSFAGRVMEVEASRRGWSAPPEVLTGPEQVALVQELLAAEDPAGWSVAFRSLLHSPTFATEVTDFVLRTREQLIDADRLATMAAGRDDWRGMAGFLARYEAVLRDRGRVDYGTLLAEAVWALEADREDALFDREYVVVDEYQDTTHAQERLLAVVSRRGGLTVAADPYQSIYSFRGAAVENVARFPDVFGTAKSRARRIVLTTSFRAPQAILDAAVRVTSRQLPGAAGKVIPAAGTGRVDVHRFDQETEEAEWIASEVLRLHLEEGIAYRDIGVFVRSKRRFLPDLSRALERRAVPHETPDSRLSDHPAVRFVLDAVAAATGVDGPDETLRAVRRLLLGTVYRVPLGVMREAERHHHATGLPWSDTIRAVAPGQRSLADLLEHPIWADVIPAAAGFWRVWSGVPELAGVAVDPLRSEERRAWTSLGQVLGRWNERNPDATLADYRRLTEDEDFEARPLLSYRQPAEDRLTLTTLHQSKGLEFDVVFIADAVEGVFPDLRTRDSLLGVRYLLPHVPSDPVEYRAFRLQEERRLAYTAMTRARRRVVWTATSTGFEEGRGIPSRFLALVAGTATVEEAVTPPPQRRTPVTPQEAEAAMRRLMTDPAVGAAERLAAVAVLVEAGGETLRSPDHFAGVRRRGADAGIIPPDVRLSPSQAEAYSACPRRYVLERWLRVGDETSLYAEFGTLVHRVLELTEREALEAGAAHGTVERAIAVLDDEFDAGVFGGGPIADAWYRRAVAGLSHLYEAWPSRGAVVDLERHLVLDIDGNSWQGYADRVETDGLGMKLVDYKTSKAPPSVAEVATSLQLGFYLLALAADEGLAHHGPPQSAEMWFPLSGAKSLTTRSFDPDRLEEVRAELFDITRRIKSEDWEPQPNAGCDRCRVRLVCPAWPEGREAFVS